MRADRHGARLVVVRIDDESGRSALRLVGELDLSTVDLLDAQIGDTREHSPPSVIDISDLRFLDLTGLRALRRAGHRANAAEARLVGATGVVRHLIELARMLDAERTSALVTQLARESTRRVAPVEQRRAVVVSGSPQIADGLPDATATRSTPRHRSRPLTRR